jgi:hypothetical protein
VIKGSRLPCVARQVTETVLARQAGQRFPSPARFLRDNVRQHADTASSRARDILPTASYRRNRIGLMRPAGGRGDGPGVPIEPGTGAVHHRRQLPGLRHSGAARPGGLSSKGGSPEVPPSPGAAQTAGSQHAGHPTPAELASQASSEGRDILHLPGGRAPLPDSPVRARRAKLNHGTPTTHFWSTFRAPGQRPVHRSTTALHSPGATGRTAGGRNSLASASRCRWDSGPRPATTRATHSRSSSES